MVKFSHGCWHPAADTIIDWAVETVKAKARDDSLHFVTVSISKMIVLLAVSDDISPRLRNPSTSGAIP